MWPYERIQWALRIEIANLFYQAINPRLWKHHCMFCSSLRNFNLVVLGYQSSMVMFVDMLDVKQKCVITATLSWLSHNKIIKETFKFVFLIPWQIVLQCNIFKALKLHRFRKNILTSESYRDSYPEKHIELRTQPDNTNIRPSLHEGGPFPFLPAITLLCLPNQC